jgi:iron complex outermembrane receptor protein
MMMLGLSVCLAMTGGAATTLAQASSSGQSQAQPAPRTKTEAEQAEKKRDAGSGAANGVFSLGRIDVDVKGQAPSATGVRVVDQAEMQTLDAQTVTEAIATVPGVSLHRVGPRNEGMIYLRGFDLRQIPLLIDGVPVYVPYDGYVDLDRFVTDDVSEVRVTKGMTSVLVGPNALGGAINLVTKRPSEPFEGLFSVRYGNGNERSFDANVGASRPGWYFHGTGSWLQADSMPLSGDFTPTALEDGGARNNSARRDALASAKLALTPSGKGEYAVNYILQRGRKGVPPYAGTDPLVRPRFWQWPAWNKDSLYFVSNTPIGQAQYVRGRAYYDRFYNELDAFDNDGYAAMTRPSSFRSIYDDYTTGAGAEYGATLAGNQTLRAAGSIKEDIHREHNIGEPIRHFNNRTVSFGVEDTIPVSTRLTLLVGIGVDHQTTIQAENFVNDAVTPFPPGHTGGINPQAALFIAAPNGGLARFAVYHKTRLPAIKDRYSYRMGQAIPNPDLSTERATTAEAGYDAPLGRAGRLAVTGFYTAVTDLVQAFYLQPNLFQLQNVGDVRNSGFEAEWRLFPVRGVEGSIGYSYLHRNDAGDTTVPLLNTPEHKIFGYIAYSGLTRLRLVASVNHESSRAAQDDGGVLLNLAGFSTVLAKASYTIRAGLAAEVAASNVLDANYQLYPGFPEEGRVVSVNLRYRF